MDKQNTAGWLGILATGILWAAGLQTATAQDYRTGDVLITRTTAPVMDEDLVMTTIPAGSRVVAGEIRWPWVLVAVKKKDSDEDDEHCPECGQRDWTRGGIVRFRVAEQEGRLTLVPELSFDWSGWIRGWVHARYLYRQGDCGESRITFRNPSEADAVIRLVGPDRRQVRVPSGASRTVYNVRAGHYYILVRYSDGLRVAGQHFNVDATATSYSHITITLRAAVDGNYPTRGISEEVFDSWGGSE